MLLKKIALSAIAASITLAFCSTAAVAQSSAADVTSQKGIKIGAAGKSAPWGGAISLTEADAFLQSNGKCAFNVSYDMENLGGTATITPFKNNVLAAGAVVSIQSALALNAGETKQINTQAYLPPGSYALQLKLDADNNISESNENNNVVAIKINLDGKCMGDKPKPTAPALPDIVSQKGITVGGAIGGAGGKSPAWGGSIHLTPADAFLKSNGKCAFNVSYDVSNIGSAPAGPAFTNRLYAGATLVSQQTGLSLNTGETKQINTQAYLSPGTYPLYLVTDADNTIAESNEFNKTGVKIVLDPHCNAATVGTHPTTTIVTSTTSTTMSKAPTKK